MAVRFLIFNHTKTRSKSGVEHFNQLSLPQLLKTKKQKKEIKFVRL
jgi:hypothetical protein